MKTAPDANNATGTNPKAYMTIVFFDERFNYVAENSMALRVTQQGDNAAPLVLANVKAPKNGFAYIYLSNESAEPVYFDDFTVSDNRGRIIEEDHYYAFGLKIAGISSKKLGDPNEGSLQNNYGYQGGFSEIDEDIGWNDFALRNYDPQTGRWIQQDPYDEFPSPYTGMGNDPILNIDPSGGWAATGLFEGLSKVGITAVTTLGGAIVGLGVDLLSGGDGGKGLLIGASVGLASNINFSLGNVVQTLSVGTQIISHNISQVNAINAVLNASTTLIGKAPIITLNPDLELTPSFSNMDNAAEDWAKKYNGPSITAGQEYGSSFYEIIKGAYKFTIPAIDQNAGVTPSSPPPGFKKKGDIHSHGKYEKGYDNNHFSPDDKADNIKNGIPGYLSTPNGTLQKFDPKTKKVKTLSRKIPSDPKDPKRQNKISS